MGTIQVFVTGLFVLMYGVASQDSLAVFKEKSQKPFLTGCVSRDMETFYCSWSVGTFQNLTEPGDVRLFYVLPNIPEGQSKIFSKYWQECPRYSLLRENGCHFDEQHTTIWTKYKIQLRSRDNNTIYHEVNFTVEQIVYPDPPVGLNWTLLSVGITKVYADVVVSWEPPPSAARHVAMGWMNLEYETQYQEVASGTWNTLPADKETKKYLYGLRTNKDYEIRVRCTMKGFKNFSNFSNSVLITVPATETRFPVAIGFMFAAVGFAIIGMLALLSRQKKLMVIFLPPVPGPKIKGIDPELLQRGNLSELTSILTSHAVLRSDMYTDDSWVEFIEVDIDKPNEGEQEQDLDTTFLLDSTTPTDKKHLTNDFRDDDSGRASCCDQDLPDADAVEFRTPLPSPSFALHPGLIPPNQPLKVSSEDSWPGKSDLYAQVRQVTPSGEVVLVPEEQPEAREAINKHDKPKCDPPAMTPKLHLLVVENPDEVGNISTPHTSNLSTNQSAGECDTASTSSSENDVNAPHHFMADYQESPTTIATTPDTVDQHAALPSTPDYTIVDGTDLQNSLLLKSNASNGPVTPKKQVPTPEGYLSPDLLDTINF